MSTCLRLVCPTEIASSYIAYDPAQRTTDCPAILAGVATAAPTPGSGSLTDGSSSPTNTGAAGGGAVPSKGAAAVGMGMGALPIAGGVFGVVVGGLAVLL